MTQKKIHLASDNWAPAHPLILEAITKANEGYASAYGSDPWTKEAETLLKDTFPTLCKAFIVPNGTGANVFGLKLGCRRHQSVVCSDIAHIYTQESGSAESIVGCKLLPVSHQEGKITPHALLKKIQHERAVGLHSTSLRVLSITQPTEIGTIYTLDELTALSTVCQQEQLLIHIDGSRLYNAAVALDCSLHDFITASKAALLSLGGTKNGLLGVESLLIFNQELQEGSEHIHKQTLQLLSKMRYLSAQYIPFFKNKLWHEMAAHANQKAQEIAVIISKIPQLSLSCPVKTNQIFFTAPSAWIPMIQEKIACYIWDQEKNEIRLVTSWNTSEEDIMGVKEVFLAMNTIVE